MESALRSIVTLDNLSAYKCVRIRNVRQCPDLCTTPSVTTYIDPTSGPQSTMHMLNWRRLVHTLGPGNSSTTIDTFLSPHKATMGKPRKKPSTNYLLTKYYKKCHRRTRGLNGWSWFVLQSKNAYISKLQIIHMGKVSINNIGSQGKNETMYTYINKYQV